MTKRAKRGSRVLSFVLALCLIVSIAPMMTPTADAVYNKDNAPLASDATLASTEDTYAVTPAGGVLRVIDGKLWVWGSNTGYGLGLASSNPNLADGKVLQPVEHDFDFGSDIVKVIAGYENSVAVLTADGEVFTWGSKVYEFLFSRSGITDSSKNGGKTPMKWDAGNITALADELDEEGNPRGEGETEEKRQIVDIEFSSLAVFATDSDGEIWVAGTTESKWPMVHMVDGMTGETNRVFRPVSESLVNKLQDSYDSASGEPTEVSEQVGGADRRVVTKMIPSFYGGAVFIYTDDGEFFSIGWNNGGQSLIPDRGDGSYGQSQDMPLRVLTDDRYNQYGKILADMNVDMNTLQTSGYNTSVIDPQGNVWMVGGDEMSESAIYFYPTDDDVRMPTMVYNGEFNGSDAKKVFTAEKVAVFLTEDNSLYAIGANVNKFIDSTKGEGEAVAEYTQVFTELSKTDTIAGVYPTDIGIMVVTEAGEQYWTGSNASGTMGNGTTTSPPSGSFSESTQTTIPPVQPLSENKIIFEIEDADGNTYISDVDADGQEYIWKNRGKDGGEKLYDFDTNTPVLKAGKIFKLNVYFKDFQRINTFVVPIRFNPNYVRVVNGSGEQYAENATVTPGAIGESVGITKGFDSNTWPGGLLHGEGGQKGSYPKICNTNGWVSVMGSADGKSAIIGEQLMFSIYFTALKATDVNPGDENYFTNFNIAYESDTETTVGFKFTTENNLYTYDDTGAEHNDRGAGWTVSNTVNPAQPGRYVFDDPMFTPVRTSYTGFNSISLSILDENGEAYENTGEMDVGTGTPMTGTLISNKNTSTIYTIKSTTSPDADASFPQVTWGISLESQHDETMTSVNDFITIVEQGDTYIRFKVRDGYDRLDIGAIKFVATTVKKNEAGYQVDDDITVLIGDVAAPEKIAIAEKATWADETAIYYSVTDYPEGSNVFTADFPGQEAGFAATSVVWRLFDAQGNELKGAASDSVVLSSTKPGSGKFGESDYMAPTATVRPVHTTFNDDYVVLRVESVYDSNVYDEIKIKVHLRVTSLTFTQTSLRLPTNTSRDLSTLLRIGPENDYYDADLEWTYTPADPENPHLVFDGTSVISARGVAHTAGATVNYDRITVTDKLTGDTVSAYIDIYVISLDSPIKPNQVEVYNLVGDLGDYIYVKSGLVRDDKITFYKTYGTEKTTGVKGVDYIEFGPLKDEHVPFYKFPAPEGFLSSKGGEIAMTVERDGDEKGKIPLLYDPEPSKVNGYISLSGKNAGSARNEGISVQLINGPSSPGVVYTDKNGYFEYETYILPGTYSLLVYHDNYLRRIIQPDEQVGYTGIVIPSATDYAISTEDNPIVLYPGDVNVDGAINGTDINYYVRYWVGQSNTALSQFANFDFYDGAKQVIDLYDLEMLLGRSGWVTETYPKWYVPTQK